MVENIITVKKLNSWFGAHQVLRDVDFTINKNQIQGIIGPANSGKTTFLRVLNRLNYLQRGYREEGEVIFSGVGIKAIDDSQLRKRIGIIFALPQVLPVSIYDNVAYGVKIHGLNKKSDVDRIVEDSLKRAALWN